MTPVHAFEAVMLAWTGIMVVWIFLDLKIAGYLAALQAIVLGTVFGLAVCGII